MTTDATMPDPVELLEKATQRVLAVADGVSQAQAEAPTPCAEWNVRDLLNHLLGGLEFATGAMTGNQPSINPSGADSSLTGESLFAVVAQAYRAELGRVLELARQPGVMERTATTTFGEMPISRIMTGILLDQFIHCWDLAKATGQDTTLDPDLTEFVYTALSSGFADMGREAGLVGPIVSVPEDASRQDQMIGYMGRQP